MRHAIDLEAIRGTIAKRLHTTPPIAVLQADVGCYADLRVEAEVLGKPVSWNG